MVKVIVMAVWGKWLLESQVVPVCGVTLGATSLSHHLHLPQLWRKLPIHCWVDKESFWKIPRTSCVWTQGLQHQRRVFWTLNYSASQLQCIAVLQIYCTTNWQEQTCCRDQYKRGSDELTKRKEFIIRIIESRQRQNKTAQSLKPLNLQPSRENY